MTDRFVEVAHLNSITVELVETLDFLNGLGLDVSKDFDINSDKIGFVKALSGACESASAAVCISERDKLRKIMDSNTLFVVVNASNIREDLFQAYLLAKQLTSCDYILFISGESKTADIEKTLVSGVQGPEKISFVIVKD